MRCAEYRLIDIILIVILVTSDITVHMSEHGLAQVSQGDPSRGLVLIETNQHFPVYYTIHQTFYLSLK